MIYLGVQPSEVRQLPLRYREELSQSLVMIANRDRLRFINDLSIAMSDPKSPVAKQNKINIAKIAFADDDESFVNYVIAIST